MKQKRLFLLLTVVPCVPLLLVVVYITTQQSCFEARTRELAIDKNIGPPKVSRIDDHHGQNNDWSFDSIDDHTLQLCEYPDINIRGKLQKSRIAKMCKDHYLTKEQMFPNKEHSITEFHSHLIFDDNKKVLFCFVPKVGCTNMKRLMLYMSDTIPQYTVNWPWVDYAKYIVPAMKHASFLNTTLTENERRFRISKYYKFMMVRNPFERLVSAYRNKIEDPLLFGYEDQFPERVKMEILERYRPKDLSIWKRTVRKIPYNISVTFSEFCRYITETDSDKMNEHFVPSIDICHPCLMDYDFYGNFRNYSTDTAQLIKKFETDPKFYRDESLHSPHEQTQLKLLRYYRRLSHREKFKLLGALHDEVLFYYTLYPSQRFSHKELLGIDVPILTSS